MKRWEKNERKRINDQHEKFRALYANAVHKNEAASAVGNGAAEEPEEEDHL